jgi:Uma2 family endonuclease
MTTLVGISDSDYEQFLALPENRQRRFERIAGEIIEKMPTQLHAYIIHLISGFLFVFLRENPIGYALIEARYRLPSDEDNDLIPDLSFVRKERAPLVRSGAAPYMPDLAVEAQSEGQSDRFMLEKAQLYLANGTRMVWLVYSTRNIIEVLTLTDRQLLTLQDTLTGGDVLPGFRVAVRDLFPVADETA